MSKFAVGEKWYCDRSKGGNPYNKPPFYFVIVGPSRPGYKMCALLKEDGTPVYPRTFHENSYHEYSHKHLKKYAVHVPREA